MNIVLCKKWEPRTSPNAGEVYTYEDYSIHLNLLDFQIFSSDHDSVASYLKPDMESIFIVGVSAILKKELEESKRGLFIKKKDILASRVYCKMCFKLILANSFISRKGVNFCSSSCSESWCSEDANRKLEFILINSQQGRCQEYSC